jgi:hypothetical protein
MSQDYDNDVLVLRLDEEGRIRWGKTYGGTSEDVGIGVALDKNGDIVIVGYTEGVGAENEDALVLKLDGNGNVEWQKTYGGPEGDMAIDVAFTPDGDLVVAGFYGISSWNAIGSRRWVMRLNREGGIEWQRAYGKVESERRITVSPTLEGSIIIGGDYLLNINPHGDLKWAENVHTIDTYVTEEGILTFADFDVVGRLDVNSIPKYSGWMFEEDISIRTENTNAIAKDLNVDVNEFPAKAKAYEVEVHGARVQFKTIWEYIPSESAVFITSTPPGADVYVNGSYIGQTPLNISLESGIYELRLSLNGYADYTTTIEITPGKTERVDVQLKRVENVSRVFIVVGDLITHQTTSQTYRSDFSTVTFTTVLDIYNVTIIGENSDSKGYLIRNNITVLSLRGNVSAIRVVYNLSKRIVPSVDYMIMPENTTIIQRDPVVAIDIKDLIVGKSVEHEIVVITNVSGGEFSRGFMVIENVIEPSKPAVEDNAKNVDGHKTPEEQTTSTSNPLKGEHSSRRNTYSKTSNGQKDNTCGPGIVVGLSVFPLLLRRYRLL